MDNYFLSFFFFGWYDDTVTNIIQAPKFFPLFRVCVSHFNYR